METLKKKLNTSGKRLNKQKQAILDYLCSVTCHPDAETVYLEVHKNQKEIGLRTVFRNLRELAKDGIILELHSPEGKRRYDGNAKHHLHFFCRQCQKVDDIFDFKDVMMIKQDSVGQIEQIECNICGVCNECLEKNNTRRKMDPDLDLNRCGYCDDEFSSPSLVGHRLPDIELDAYQNGKFIKVSTANYRGKWLVIVFYPADFTFVCPTELRELAATYANFQKENAEILSVSTDTMYVHKAWHDQSKAISEIAFPMVADPAAKLAKMLGVYLREDGMALRGTFVVDPDGIIKTIEIHANSIGRSADETLRKVQAAKFVYENGNEVCPANWKPGQKTLKPGVSLVGKI